MRDRSVGKGRYDLISPVALQRLADLYENGAVKYGERNWEKGQPLSWFLDSAIRHAFRLMVCCVDEDHAAAVAWNAFGFIHTAERIRQGTLPRSLDDIGFVTALDNRPTKGKAAELIRGASQCESSSVENAGRSAKGRGSRMTGDGATRRNRKSSSPATRKA